MTEQEQLLQDQVIGLQIELVEQEKQIKDLSSVVLKMQKDMIHLQRELKQLREKLAAPAEEGVFRLEDERPPHY